MDIGMNEQGTKAGVPTERDFENAADAMGMWFAALALFAVLAAALIVYRSANSVTVTASNEPGVTLNGGAAAR